MTNYCISINLVLAVNPPAVKPPNFRLTPLKHLDKQLRPPSQPEQKQFLFSRLLHVYTYRIR
uniref:Uncharacterized protein n=1 Tax=Proteus vulgaris TaxID=585 RepID=Q8KJY8_PROVU|nr:hypothetical protein [Proteus vulgaris]